MTQIKTTGIPLTFSSFKSQLKIEMSRPPTPKLHTHLGRMFPQRLPPPGGWHFACSCMNAVTEMQAKSQGAARHCHLLLPETTAEDHLQRAGCMRAFSFLARWSKEGGPSFLSAYGAPWSVPMPTLLEDRLFQMHHFVCAQVRNCRPGSQRTGCVGCTTLCACVCGTAVLAHGGRGVSGAPLCVRTSTELQTWFTRGRVVSGAPLCVCMCGTTDLAQRTDDGFVSGAPFCVQASIERHTRLAEHRLRQVTTLSLDGWVFAGQPNLLCLGLAMPCHSQKQRVAHSPKTMALKTWTMPGSNPTGHWVEWHRRGWSCAKPSPPTLRGGVTQKEVSASKAVPANAQVWSWTKGAVPSHPLGQSKVKLTRRGWSWSKLSPWAVKGGDAQKVQLSQAVLSQMRGGDAQKEVQLSEAVPLRIRGEDAQKEVQLSEAVPLRIRGEDAQKEVQLSEAVPLRIRGEDAQKEVQLSEAVPLRIRGEDAQKEVQLSEAVPLRIRGEDAQKEVQLSEAVPLRIRGEDAQMRVLASKAVTSKCSGSESHRRGWNHAKLSHWEIRGGCWQAKWSPPTLRGEVPQKRVEPPSHPFQESGTESHRRGWMEMSQAVPSSNQGWSPTEEGGTAPSCPLQESGAESHRRGWKLSRWAIRGGVAQEGGSCPAEQSGVELPTRWWSRAKPSFPTLQGGVAQKRVELSQAVPSSNQGWSGTEAGGAAQSCSLEQSRVESHTRGSWQAKLSLHPCQCSNAELDRRSCAKPLPPATGGEVAQKRVEPCQAVPSSSQEWSHAEEDAGKQSCPCLHSGADRDRRGGVTSTWCHSHSRSGAGTSRPGAPSAWSWPLLCRPLSGRPPAMEHQSVTQDKYTIPHDTGQIHHPPWHRTNTPSPWQHTIPMTQDK